MELVASFYTSFDNFFELKKQKIVAKLQGKIKENDFSYKPDIAKLDLAISIISKIYDIPERVLKDRRVAHELNAIDGNYREACCMVFFLLLNKLNWTWVGVVDHFSVNKYCIHKYVNSFQESKKKSTKERYIYICEKIDNLEF